MKHLAAKGRGGLLLGVACVAWLVAYFAARWFLKRAEMDTWLRVAVALIPVPFFVIFLLGFIRGIGTMDELQRRIQLEALAIAFPLAVLLLMTLGLLQRAINLSFEDWSYAHVWVYLPIFYFLGIFIAARRYQ
jgi:hypothetical protein